MLRLRMWDRIGLVALAIATTALWVTVSVTPPVAAAAGAKSMNPVDGDPSGGGAPTAGDPDGPSGDVAPSGGALSGGNTLGGSLNGSAVQTPTVGVASPARPLSLWARFRLALGVWQRAFVLRF